MTTWSAPWWRSGCWRSSRGSSVSHSPLLHLPDQGAWPTHWSCPGPQPSSVAQVRSYLCWRLARTGSFFFLRSLKAGAEIAHPQMFRAGHSSPCRSLRAELFPLPVRPAPGDPVRVPPSLSVPLVTILSPCRTTCSFDGVPQWGRPDVPHPGQRPLELSRATHARPHEGKSSLACFHSFSSPPEKLAWAGDGVGETWGGLGHPPAQCGSQGVVGELWLNPTWSYAGSCPLLGPQPGG